MAVLVGVLLLGCLGASLQVARSYWQSGRVMEAYDKRDMVVRSHLDAARKSAHENGFQGQLDVLRSRAAEIEASSSKKP